RLGGLEDEGADESARLGGSKLAYEVVAGGAEADRPDEAGADVHAQRAGAGRFEQVTDRDEGIPRHEHEVGPETGTQGLYDLAPVEEEIAGKEDSLGTRPCYPVRKSRV